MQLSAIIPTHDRPAQLRRCLETLRTQDVDPSALEVVVVDDGSTIDLKSLVVEVAAGAPIAMRCERQELTGLNAARNRGVSAALGGLLAFLDDDTLVSPGWARALLEAFQDPECGGVGGRVELQLSGQPPPWFALRPYYAYYLAEYDLGPEPRWLRGDPAHGGDRLPVGANCAVRREDFERLGGFRQGLDRVGRSLVSNGDTDFFRRLTASGGRLRYAPDAKVVHCVPAGRLTVRYFARRYFAQGVSDELLLAQEGERVTTRHRFGLVRMVARRTRMLGQDVLRGRGYTTALFEINYWLGRCVGLRRG